MKKEVITRIVVYSMLAIAILYAYRFRILDFINDYFYDEYVMEELTAQQKREDFDAFYSNMVESIPFLDEVKELYDIDFRERYEYYLEEIENKENNFEYYCTLKAICKDIPSFHTDFCFPLYSNVRGLSCYNSRKITTSLGQKSKIDAWTKIIENAVHDYEDINILRVTYVDGKYVADELYLPDFYEHLKGYELVEIDGMSADWYITKTISTLSLHYDGLQEKAYRASYTFNDQVGKQVKVLWENQEREQKEEEMYLDYGAEVVSSYGHLFSSKWAKYAVNMPSVTMYRDDENHLEYIAVNDFQNSDGEELKKYLENTIYDTIVIDLRNNYGGCIEYAQQYIYPALYEENVKQSYSWIVPSTEKNRAVTEDWIVRLSYKSKNDGTFHYYSTHNTYRGKADCNRDVYYLVGAGTGSAADTYVAMIKEKHLGTIVGSATGGEGLGASFVCEQLDNSSLIYVYYPSVAYDPDTNEKFYMGTMPDYYVSGTQEEYELRQYYMAEGTAWEYENQLMHDAVLKWVVEKTK